MTRTTRTKRPDTSTLSRPATLLVRFVFLVALLAACSSLDNLPTLAPTLPPPPTPTRTQAEPTHQPTPKASPTASPTSEPTLQPSSTPLPPPSPTPTKDQGRFTFTVCGDSRGGDDVYRQILSRTVADGSAFLVNTGDVVHTGEIDQLTHVRDLMAEYPLTIHIAPGNHDTQGGSLRNFMGVLKPLAPQYSFDRGQVHFVILNSSSGSLPQEQLDWLHADLSATQQPVKMVFLHHPPFDPIGTDHIMAHGQEPFMAAMRQHNVDYVFAGHIHSYDEELRDGTHYYITGGAGAPLYGHSERPAFYHYLRVRVDGTQIQVELVRLD